jgi:ankyrin repeat protein
VAELLLRHGADPNTGYVHAIQGDDPATLSFAPALPLVEAARADRAGMVRLLIRSGADPNAGEGAALAVAASASVVEAPLDNGAVPHPSTNALLVNMAYIGCAAAVRRLLEAGVDPNCEARGMTPLYAAKTWRRGEVETLLRQYGAAEPAH